MYSIIQPDRTIIKSEGERNNGYTVTVFLAGTIEMGAGVRWHAEAAERIYRTLQGKAGGALMMPELAFYNPRRDDGFAPGMEDRQIRWEQERLREADYVFMYLQADTKSPVSLLEFGQFIASGRLYVACDPSFYRWRNLKVTAGFDHAADHVVDSVDECIEKVTDAMLARQGKHES